MTTIALEGLTKHYQTRRGPIRALHDLTLTGEAHELLVLVGPSGCGKTTCLRMIAGLEQPDHGSIRIASEDVTNMAPRERDVAMVFQHHALYPHLSVFENIAFGLKARGVPKAHIRPVVVQTANRLGLSDCLDRRPAKLAGGEQQRVALARAIVRRPQLFLFDEPLSSLDAGLRLRMRTEIKSLQRELRTTLIHVTHDQAEAMTLGDRMAVLKEGVLQQVGSPLEVYDRPSNLFVASFIGTPTMNLLKGTLERTGEAGVFDCGLGRLPLSPKLMPDGHVPLPCRALLGARSEHLVRIADRGPPASAAPGPAIRLGVDFIEALGDRSYAHMTAPDGAKLVATLDPTAEVEAGASVTYALDLSRCHLFASDAEGDRIGGA